MARIRCQKLKNSRNVTCPMTTVHGSSGRKPAARSMPTSTLTTRVAKAAALELNTTKRVASFSHREVLQS